MSITMLPALCLVCVTVYLTDKEKPSPETAAVFRGAQESHTFPPQEPQRMHISWEIKSPGFTSLWLNSEQPDGSQRTFCAAAYVDFHLKLGPRSNASSWGKAANLCSYTSNVRRGAFIVPETSSALKGGQSFWDVPVGLRCVVSFVCSKII